MHFYPFFELTSNSLTTIWVEPHQCPSHQLYLYPGTNPWNFHKIYWELTELCRPFGFFCFIPIQISHNLCDSKDGTKFWWLPCFPAKSSEMIAIVSHWIKKLQLYVRTNISMSLYLCTYWFLQHKIIRSSQQHWQIKNSL